MHSRNVVHLDIKPENILLKDGNFYLSDFGLAKNLNCKVDLETIQEGDGRYCSGEIMSDSFILKCQNQPELLKKSDLFSLGLVLLRVL